MKSIKESKTTLFLGIVLILVLCVVWVIVKQYKMLIIGALMLICLICGHNKPILKYDENGIELQMSSKKVIVPWGDVVYIGERVSNSVFGRKAFIVQVKWLWGQQEQTYTVKMSYNSDGVQELLEYWQTILREMQKDYD